MDGSFQQDRDRAEAVATLTAKERECLRRWLSHATAKEIARDLSITHHAVEKRLKSARQKLGVASSLEAARMLSAADGRATGETTVYGSAEVAGTAHTAYLGGNGAVTRSGTPGAPRRRAILVPGVIGMSVILATALLVSVQADRPADEPRPPTTIDTVRELSFERFSPEARFADLDKDASGFIEAPEIEGVPIVPQRLVMPRDVATYRERIGRGEFPVARIEIPALMASDSDGDGRIDLEEFRRWDGAIGDPS